MEEVFRYINKIREKINSARKQNILSRDQYLWNQLCSSLDIIEDTTKATIDYLDIKSEEKLGLKYIYVFGILQILFVQQDAIKHMGEALNIEIEFDDELLKIRDIRNNSIGHPTKRGKGKSTTYNFIARVYLSHKKLTLMSVSPKLEKSTSFLHYDIHNLIDKQKKSLLPILEEVLNKLEKEEMEHINKFKDDKLVECFHPTLNYHFQKVYESRWGNTPLDVSKIDFTIIENALSLFKAKLEEREILEAYDGVTIVLEELEYPLTKLKEYFNRESTLEPENITIYNHYIESKFGELIEMAKELDENYSNKNNA